MTVEKSKELREFVFKIVILGDAAVGKTSLINQFCEDKFQDDYKPTLGANIIRKDVDIDGEDVDTKIRLIMWDLAGQEKYSVIRSMYFQGCEGALLLYDLTRYNTFDSIKTKWLRDFKKYIRKKGVYILIGNKSDLSDERVIPTEKGKDLAEDIQASHFIETSAKLGENIEEAFLLLVRQILSNHDVNL
ncbi:MAG: GTP-binding protein [Candidatus Lokiarchaeota archaeon]|nr:GTP-binding protein [Candidatus Lokiarchaeota archaeon]